MSHLFPRYADLETGHTLVIREARPSDARATIACLNQAGGETDFLTFGANEFNVTIAREQDFIKWCREMPNSLMLLAEVEGQLTGLLTLEGNQRPRMRHVADLGISLLQQYWGQGIGRQLLQTGLDWAGQTGILRKINLRVHEENRRAIHLYESFGFQREGLVSREYRLNGHFYANILMGLTID
ncbi:MAG: GNAT family protein [Anaerolineae bacterium]